MTELFSLGDLEEAIWCLHSGAAGLKLTSDSLRNP